MDLYFLGTGGGVPSKERNVSSIALRMLPERGAIWLFDCGEGTQHQILRTPIKLSKLEKIFITHLHGDHIYGLPGLLASRSFQEDESSVTIYGPTGIRSFVETALSVAGTHLRYPLSIVEVAEGTVFEDDHVVVRAAKLNHGVPSYGYRIAERDRPGALDADRLKAEGVPPGPLYSRLKNGETVKLADGRVVNGDDYIGPPKKGKKLAILGDTRPSKAAYTLAESVDVLIHEATFMNDDAERAHRYFHSTTVDAAKIARSAGAAALIVSHISSRYKGEEKQFLQEARSVFPNSFLAKDFWTYEI
ncbi:MAG TPA: ribonuclease Z [Bacillales bacterium]|nr:ribonuclease Z [Bacillales bacterium]